MRREKTRLVAGVIVLAILSAGCGEEPPGPEPVSRGRAATAETMLTCTKCGVTFSLGEASRPNLQRPQVICPSCGKVMIPRRAAE